MQTRRSAGFPSDLMVSLTLPGLAIFASVFGAQRTWIVLFVIGLAELLGGLLALRSRRSSVPGWSAIIVGVMALAGGMLIAIAGGFRFAIFPW